MEKTVPCNGEKSKNNCIGGNTTPFGSECLYYSYGNIGNYGMVNNSSVGRYANRSYVKSSLKTELSHFNAIVMEEMVSYELGTGITGMTVIIPNITKLIAPVMNTAFALKEEKVDVNLKKVSSSEDGL